MKKLKMITVVLFSLFLLAGLAGCATDIEVERTKLPHIDKTEDADTKAE